MTSRPTISHGGSSARLTVLAPQAQRDGGRVVQVAGLLPVADLGVVVRVPAGQQEGMVVRELFESAPDLLQRGLPPETLRVTCHSRGTSTGCSPCDSTSSLGPVRLPGRHAGQGALLAGRTRRRTRVRDDAGPAVHDASRRPRRYSHGPLPPQGALVSRRPPLRSARADRVPRSPTGLPRFVPETKLSRPRRHRGALSRNVPRPDGRPFRARLRVQDHQVVPVYDLPLVRRRRAPAPAPGWSGRAAGGSPWRRS